MKKPTRSILEDAFSLNLSGRSAHLPDRIAMLGIPEEELSESVMLALSALFERMDDMGLEQRQSEERLKEMESLVDVDFLAPVPNRRAFMRRLDWVISMLNRYGHPSTVLFFDLNGFKAINDAYGHAAGDMAIRHVAEILNDAKRESDFLARLGGDEFGIILYNAKEKDAKKRARFIAEKINSTPFSTNHRQMTLSTSVGVHEIRKNEKADDALHEADRAMYRHKEQLKKQQSGVKLSPSPAS